MTANPDVVVSPIAQGLPRQLPGSIPSLASSLVVSKIREVIHCIATTADLPRPKWRQQAAWPPHAPLNTGILGHPPRCYRRAIHWSGARTIRTTSIPLLFLRRCCSRLGLMRRNSATATRLLDIRSEAEAAPMEASTAAPIEHSDS